MEIWLVENAIDPTEVDLTKPVQIIAGIIEYTNTDGEIVTSPMFEEPPADLDITEI